MEIVFNYPGFLWFLLAIPFLIITHFLTLKYSKTRALKFSNFEAIARVTKEDILSKPYRGFLRNKNVILLTMRAMALSSLVLAISGTVLWYEGRTTDFDFILAIDSSSSMLADDFSPNRLEATKIAASLFLDNLAPKSKVGLVTFSGTSFVNEQPTEDISLLKKAVSNITISKIGGTDLATAIITSSNLLIGSEKGKVVVLLTDGQSNVGAPVEEGTSYASKEGVRVHTIGVGTEKGGKFFGVELVSKLDETNLKRIAELTGGKYFRADTKEGLTNAYNEIAGFNTRKIKLNISPILMLVALLLLSLEWTLINTKYKTTP